MNSASVPIRVKVVAGLFFLQGVIAFLDMVRDALAGWISFNLGILGIFIGFGLLRLSRAWQVIAMLYILIGVVLVPVIGLIIVIGKLGVSVVPPVGWVLVGLPIVLGLWAYRVLTRDEIHGLFVGTRPSPSRGPRKRLSRPLFEEPDGGLDSIDTPRRQ